MSSSKKKWFKKKENWWIVGGFSVAVLGISVPFAIMIATGWNFSYKQFANLGGVGDFFGGTTVGILSLSSILLVTAAIVMQKEELSLQREEIEKTRKEYELTNRTMKRQQFDNTFFNMISLHHQIVNSFIYRHKTKPSEGRNALADITRKLYVFYNNPTIDMLSEINKDKNDLGLRARVAYNKFYSDFELSLGHYFRNLYRIIKLIDESDLEKKEKNSYLGIIRAQLSTAELVLIFYNNNTSRGEKFKELVKKYDFFDNHLQEKILLDPTHKELLK